MIFEGRTSMYTFFAKRNFQSYTSNDFLITKKFLVNSLQLRVVRRDGFGMGFFGIPDPGDSGSGFFILG